MTTIPCKCHLQESSEPSVVLPTNKAAPTNSSRHLHRVREVQYEQGVSDRTLAARMSISVEALRKQQQPSTNLMLSELYRWQAALDVPVADLLVEPGPALSPSVLRRARLLKVMKTVRSMQRAADPLSFPVLVEQLAEQLIELMPELINVDSWPVVGKRRTTDDLSPIEERMLPDSVLDGTWTPDVDHD